MSTRHALTDAQWDRIQNLLPGKEGDPGRSGSDNRRFVDAILFILKTGVPWRDLPERFGKWNSVWKRFGRWCKRGVWQGVAKELGEGAKAEDILKIMESLAGVAMKQKAKDKIGPFGFNKKNKRVG